MPSELAAQQVKTLKFGVRATNPAGEGEEIGDLYFNDGSGVLPEGEYVYTSGGWVILGAGGGGVITLNTLAGNLNLVAGAGINVNPGVPTPTDIQLVATGGGGAEAMEKPDKYHDVSYIPDASNNGNANQRCIAYGKDNMLLNDMIYVLWHDGDGNLHLTIEKHANFGNQSGYANGHQREMFDMVLTFQDIVDSEWLYPNLGDFCLVLDSSMYAGAEVLHIFFSALKGSTGCQNIYDGVLIPVVNPTPGSALTLLVMCYQVNQVSAINNPCKQVSAAWQSQYTPLAPATETIVVAYSQFSNTAFWDVKVNHFDYGYIFPASPYATLPEVMVSNGTDDGLYPTVEVNNRTGEAGALNPNTHIAWIQSEVGFGAPYHLWYCNENPATGIFSPSADVTVLGVNTDIAENAPTMVAIENQTSGFVELTVCVKEAPAPFLMHSYRFDESIAGGVTVYDEGQIEWYDINHWSTYGNCYQLGATKYWHSNAQPVICLFYRHCMPPPSAYDGQYHLVLNTWKFGELMGGLHWWGQTELKSCQVDFLITELFKFQVKVYFGRKISTYTVRDTLKTWYPPSLCVETRPFLRVNAGNMEQIPGQFMQLKDMYPYMMQGQN